MMEKKINAAVPATGFVSGNETNYNWSEDEFVLSEKEIGRSTSGW